MKNSNERKKRSERLCKLNEEYSTIIMKLTESIEFDKDENDINHLRRANLKLDYVNKKIKYTKNLVEKRNADLQKQIEKLENTKINKNTRKLSPTRQENAPSKKANIEDIEDEEINKISPNGSVNDLYDDNSDDAMMTDQEL